MAVTRRVQGRTLSIGGTGVIGPINVRRSPVTQQKIGFEVGEEFLPFEQFAAGVPIPATQRGRRTLATGGTRTPRNETRRARLRRIQGQGGLLGGAFATLG